MSVADDGSCVADECPAGFCNLTRQMMPDRAKTAEIQM